MLERMRSMRAHREHELEQKFVGRETFSIARAPKLPAYLAELARPIGQHERSAGVAEERATIGRIAQCRRFRVRLDTAHALRSIEPAAEEPAASELVIPRR